MALRLAIAQERGFGDDLNSTVLAKIMLAERFAPEVYDAIARGSAGTGASEELAALEAEVAAAPELSRRLDRDLQASPRQALAAWRERIPASADVEFYEQLLQKERREAQALGDRIARITSDLGAALASGPGTETSLQELRRRLDVLAAPVVAADGEPAALTESRRARQAAERERLAAELALREAQASSAAVRQRAQELELRVLRLRLSQHEPRLNWLQERIRDQSRAALQALVEDMDRRADALPPDDPVLGQAAATNLALAGDLLAANEQLADYRARLAGAGGRARGAARYPCPARTGRKQ